jgi:hypothetical protein
MSVIKPSGAAPRYADPLRREIRGDLRGHDQGVIAGTVASEKAKLAGEALAELAAVINVDVRQLSPTDYRKAKSRALALTRRALDPKP